MPIKKVVIVSDDKEELGCLPMAFGGLVLVVIILLLLAKLTDNSPPPPDPAFVPPTQPKPAPRLVPRFAPLSPRQYPAPQPEPVFLGRHPTNGGHVFGWQGRQWILSPRPNRPYTYLCVAGGTLNWCWQNPPHPDARPCTDGSSPSRTPGWCWDEKQF